MATCHRRVQRFGRLREPMYVCIGFAISTLSSINGEIRILPVRRPPSCVSDVGRSRDMVDFGVRSASVLCDLQEQKVPFLCPLCRRCNNNTVTLGCIRDFEHCRRYFDISITSHDSRISLILLGIYRGLEYSVFLLAASVSGKRKKIGRLKASRYAYCYFSYF